MLFKVSWDNNENSRSNGTGNEKTKFILKTSTDLYVGDGKIIQAKTELCMAIF
jgi:hypothetical protein